MRDALNLDTPANILNSTPPILGYQPEPGRLVVHLIRDNTLIFSASIETPNNPTPTSQVLSDIDAITGPANANNATDAVIILYTYPNDGHLNPDTITNAFNDAGINPRTFLLASQQHTYRDALVTGSPWETIDTPTGPALPYRDELMPAAGAPLEVGLIAAAWDVTRALQVEERVGLAMDYLDLGAPVSDSLAALVDATPATETLAALVAETAVRDWVLRELGRLNRAKDPDRLAATGARLLTAAMAAPQPWASNMAAVAAVAYYCAGRAGIEMQTALALAAEGPSRSLAGLITQCVMTGMAPQDWAAGACSLTDADILAARGTLLDG